MSMSGVNKWSEKKAAFAFISGMLLVMLFFVSEIWDDYTAARLIEKSPKPIEQTIKRTTVNPHIDLHSDDVNETAERLLIKNRA